MITARQGAERLNQPFFADAALSGCKFVDTPFSFLYILQSLGICFLPHFAHRVAFFP